VSKPALLAVDDDGPVLSAIERDLRDRYAERYQVYTASAGEQALDRPGGGQWRPGTRRPSWTPPPSSTRP